jgi:hypothetical protein
MPIVSQQQVGRLDVSVDDLLVVHWEGGVPGENDRRHYFSSFLNQLLYIYEQHWLSNLGLDIQLSKHQLILSFQNISDEWLLNQCFAKAWAGLAVCCRPLSRRLVGPTSQMVLYPLFSALLLTMSNRDQGSKLVHYIGNRVPFETKSRWRTHSIQSPGWCLWSRSGLVPLWKECLRAPPSLG